MIDDDVKKTSRCVEAKTSDRSKGESEKKTTNKQRDEGDKEKNSEKERKKNPERFMNNCTFSVPSLDLRAVWMQQLTGCRAPLIVRAWKVSTEHA